MKNLIRNKGWFVIINEWENKLCKTSAQLAVYTAIKSFCGNGKLKKGISLRDIGERAKFSIGWIKIVIGELKELELVFTHGAEQRRGGSVEVFSVGTERSVRSVQLVEESVPSVSRSVQSTGTTPLQSNKVIMETEKRENFSIKEISFGNISLEENGESPRSLVVARWLDLQASKKSR